MPALLAVIYGVLVAVALPRSEGGFSSPAGVGLAIRSVAPNELLPATETTE